MYEITTQTTFAASHALRLADGSVEPVHSHHWRVRVTVARAQLDAMETVMDFHELERIVAEVLAPWRDQHLNDVAPFAGGAVNPSAERVAQWIGKNVAKSLPPGVALLSASVTEAPGCEARYVPEGV